MAADKKDNDATFPTAIVVSDDRKDRPLMPARPTLAQAAAQKDRALVLSRPMIARDLDQAAKGQLVYVGRDGEVKDPARVRNRQVAWYVAFGRITAGGVTLAASSLPIMIPFYAALCGRLVGQVRAVKRVNQASAALSNGDTAAGRALAEPISRAWWAPGRVRILAELRVAFADALDGRGDQALERLRQARAKLSPRLVQYQFSYYTEINLLIAPGRIKDPPAPPAAGRPVPPGEVLRFPHWIAERPLGVAEGKLDIDDTELHDRRRK